MVVNIHLPDGSIIEEDWTWVPGFNESVFSSFKGAEDMSDLRCFSVVEKSEDEKDVWIEWR